MYELTVTATKVLGTCTAHPAVKKGDYFTVKDGDIRVPGGGFICLWALQNVLPIITPKERSIAEEKDQDWMWRVHHAQCPDPNGRVIFKIERTGAVDKTSDRGIGTQRDSDGKHPPVEPGEAMEDGLRSLRVVVEEVKGRCTSGMNPGDGFILRSGRLYIPPDGHFCLYALHAVMPLLPAKQRAMQDGDWLKDDNHVICPDPAGNVILRIEPLTETEG